MPVSPKFSLLRLSLFIKPFSAGISVGNIDIGSNDGHNREAEGDRSYIPDGIRGLNNCCCFKFFCIFGLPQPRVSVRVFSTQSS